MQGTVELKPYAAEQIQITVGVFATIAAIDIWPVDSGWNPTGEQITAAIYFTEPFKSAMFLECETPLAFALTSRFMGVETPVSVDADVCDSMAELINMIAGNLKALMPAETGISIPSIVRGMDYVLQFSRRETMSTIVFDSDFGELRLTLIG